MSNEFKDKHNATCRGKRSDDDKATVLPEDLCHRQHAYAALNSFEPPTKDILIKYIDLLHETNFYGFTAGFPDHAHADEREFVYQATIQNVVAVIDKWMLHISRD